MKYSQLIGIILGLALITVCFFPWSYIQSKDLIVTGMSAPNTNFGKPGLMNIYVTAVSIILFAIPKIWAKRTNIFFTMFNMGWSIRNFIILAVQFYGETPVRQWGLYVSLILSILIFIMSLLPKLEIKPKAS
jgi:hypothetical protein